jgi:hypothetical protein
LAGWSKKGNTTKKLGEMQYLRRRNTSFNARELRGEEMRGSRGARGTREYTAENQ